jgi:hypothetical protein
VKRYVRKLGQRTPLPSAAWSAHPAKRPKSTSAPARRWLRPTASAARRTSFASS